MKTLVCTVLLAGFAPAGAGVLQECDGALTCVRQARSAATEEMLEHFLGVEQAIGAADTDAAKRARAALKQSQRTFERYVLDHCHGLHGLLAGGEAALLACETDLLRQRASALQALEGATNRI